MRPPSPLIRGTLLKRYRRFLADVRLEDGSLVTAHCPNSGTLRGCSEPGASVLLSDSRQTTRKNPMTWEFTEADGARICINNHLCRKVLLEAVGEGRLPSLAGYTGLDTDAVIGRGARVDIMLSGHERNAFVAVHHVTWAEQGVALFPDAVQPRACATLGRLAGIARQDHHAVALFLVQREDCTLLRPAEQVDREFLKAMLAASGAGVEILAHRLTFTVDDWRLGPVVPCSLS